MAGPAWMDEALCRNHSDINWHPDKHENATRAISICMACPVRTPCLNYAVERRESGVWGATTDEQRDVIRNPRLPRPKPRLGRMCGRGHEDWRILPDGSRECRECSAARQNEYRQALTDAARSLGLSRSEYQRRYGASIARARALIERMGGG